MLAQTLAEVLRPAVEVERSFQEQGLDSLLALEAIGQLKRRLGLAELAAPLFFEHPSVRQLAEHLAARHAPQLAQHLAARSAPTVPRAASEPASPAAPLAP